ncbi:uncharacterized protein LOC108739809 [Agrilus planipennis]|uniref:Uncharacterized protein LOC108739809 n=1 Tax=Agrilus planipennis TaxID=224129 RepID=A0A1W4XAE9_AGRPL|nr:uncharacterized protein LOC108739809 [Agrilus planipennis]XP_018329386.1 uncharacterized protein LOC108739809 [Agrilus planipennis]
MLRWLGPKKAPTHQHQSTDGIATDDPLAVIDFTGKSRKIYSVTRSNPLYDDDGNIISSNHSSPNSELGKEYGRNKSSSSGYSGSHQGSSSNQELFDSENVKFREDTISILEQNEDYVKSIQIGCGNKRLMQSRASSLTTGTGANLSAIPEGKIDCLIPSPIWPDEHLLKLTQTRENFKDSLVDETLLLYTSFSYIPDDNNEEQKDISVKELLLELSEYVDKMCDVEITKKHDPEQVLRSIKEKITTSLEALKNCTEEEVRRLCINLSNKARSNSVVRALSNSSSSGNSSQSSPEWSGGCGGGGGRVRTYSSEIEDIYHLPTSGSSSSGFSDVNNKLNNSRYTLFDDFVCDQNDLRNTLIYATLYRTKLKLLSGANERIFERNKWNRSSNTSSNQSRNKNLLRAARDTKPSVWEQYYGVKTVPVNVSTTYVPKPADVPLFPGGRPEADFTLDLPRSEFLNKKMKEDKKWRCRCRLLTTFLGFIFFILSVMAVSLILTKGKRMFGSMV